MTYDEWRESYFSGQLMNEAMARDAWDFAVIAEREACAQVCDDISREMFDHAKGPYRRCAAAIRSRGKQ